MLGSQESLVPSPQNSLFAPAPQAPGCPPTLHPLAPVSSSPHPLQTLPEATRQMLSCPSQRQGPGCRGLSVAGARSPELNGCIQRERWPRRAQCWTVLPVSLEKAGGLIFLCLRSFALQSPSAPHTHRHTDLHRCAHETYTLWHTHTDTHVHTQMQTHTHVPAPPPHTHAQLRGRWLSRKGWPGPSVCSGWSPAGVGTSGPPRVCWAGVHKWASSPGLHLTDCGFLGGPGPRSSVPACGEDGMLSSEPTGPLVLRGFPA